MKTKVIKFYGSDWCPMCVRSKKILDDNKIKYEYIDLKKMPSAVGIVEKMNKGMKSIPTIIFPDGKILVEPADEDLFKLLSDRNYLDLS